MASFLKIVRSMFGAKSNPTDEEINQVNFNYVNRDDPAMLAATQEARESVAQFVQLLKNPPHPQAAFHVKKRFVDGDRTETMWLSDVQIRGDEFAGLIGNDPQILTQLKCGDEATVGIDEIHDWMVLVGDEMIGAFTVHVGR